MAHDRTFSLEEGIDQWRSYARRREGIHTVDVAELEDHLREQIAGLVGAGLASDEAFLVAVKRLGSLDALSSEFAREHTERLWKQLVVSGSGVEASPARARTEIIVVFCLAVAAALAIKAPELFGVRLRLAEYTGFYTRNVSFFVLPMLTGYFAWKRKLDQTTLRWIAVVFATALVFANSYPYESRGSTEGLTSLHLPIALMLVVGVAYTGDRWKQVAGRMDFIRFSGELAIYYALMVLGGGILTAFMFTIFQAMEIDAEYVFSLWLLPCLAMAAIIVASWLVEAKQSVIENMAPVLTRLFTPLYAAVLVGFLGTLLWSNRIDVSRDVLLTFDRLLVTVLALVLYTVSARAEHAPPDAFDMLQVVLIVSALLVDVVALWAIGERISRFGASPNRVAAVGVNVILLVNLVWSAVLYVRFLRGRESFTALEKWQTDFLPAYAAWAAVVVLVFPPLFRYV